MSLDESCILCVSEWRPASNVDVSSMVARLSLSLSSRYRSGFPMVAEAKPYEQDHGKSDR